MKATAPFAIYHFNRIAWYGLAANLAAVPLTALALFVLWFFRDPVRALPEAADLVIAPGEGRIIDIVEIEEPTFLRSTARRITIFLSVFDVHVQRAPVTGTVEHKSYKRGKYLVAWLEKASDACWSGRSRASWLGES